MHSYTAITALQDVLAPFVLQNLNCSGTESRLLDCPGVTQEMGSFDDYDDVDEPYGSYDSTILSSLRSPDNRACDPLAFAGNLAFVACGNSDDTRMPLAACHQWGSKARATRQLN